MNYIVAMVCSSTRPKQKRAPWCLRTCGRCLQEQKDSGKITSICWLFAREWECKIPLNIEHLLKTLWCHFWMNHKPLSFGQNVLSRYRHTVRTLCSESTWGKDRQRERHRERERETEKYIEREREGEGDCARLANQAESFSSGQSH